MKVIPPSDAISRMIASASVVLPDPLSPTMPSVSPARTDSVASFTAFTWPTVRFSRPCWIGNQILQLFGLHDLFGPCGTGSGTTAMRAQQSWV